MRLKKGDLVEVIGCRDLDFEKFVGKRFNLNRHELIQLGGGISRGWVSPFETVNKIFVPVDKYLRKVNPDGDELSDESFESLLEKLKSYKKDNNIITVSIELDENLNE